MFLIKYQPHNSPLSHSYKESEHKKIEIMEDKNLAQYAYQDLILNARNRDTEHLNNPENQIATLAILVNELLKDNESGKNEPIIGLYANIGRSLKQLIEYQTQQRRNSHE